MALASGYVATLVTLGYTPAKRLSTFEGDVTIGGNTFEGGKLLRVGRLTVSRETPDRRMTLTLAAVESADLNLYLADHGPIAVTVEWLASQDGATWTLLPKKHVGVQSAIVVTGGQAELTVETAKGTVWAGEPLVMSDATQRERYKTPTPDRAFEYVQRLRLEGIATHRPG